MVDSFIDQYARQIGAVPTHWSHSGDKASGWQGKVERKWFMYGDAIAAPDAVVYFMGSNDLSEGVNLAEMQARISETAEAIRAKLTPVLFGATLLPRTNQPAGSTFETVRRQVNAWLPDSGLFRTVFPFAAAVSSDDENLDPAIDADGVHLTTAGYGRLAAAINQPMIEPPEPSAPDTDWRNVTGALVNGWTADRVEVRRKDDRTILRFANLDGSAATDSYFVHGMKGFFAGGQNLPVNVGAAMHFL